MIKTCSYKSIALLKYNLMQYWDDKAWLVNELMLKSWLVKTFDGLAVLAGLAVFGGFGGFLAVLAVFGGFGG